MTAPASAYPRSVDDLMPEARQVPVRDGERVPSQRQLMLVLKVGADKAKQIRDRLIEEDRRRTVRPAREAAAHLGLPVDRIAALYERHGFGPNGHRPDADGTAPEQRAVDPAPPATTAVTNVVDHPGTVGEPATVALPDAGDTEPEPTPAPESAAPPAQLAVETTEQPRVDVDTDDTATSTKAKPVVVWPVWLMMAPAFVSVWAGWVGLGERTGYGVMNLLPGFTDKAGGPLLSINTAITLPIGMEVYAAYALYVCLSGRVPSRARKFAGWSAAISLLVGAAGQVAYHLLVEADLPATPWWITTAVSCLPVAVLGMGAALAHLVRAGDER